MIARFLLASVFNTLLSFQFQVKIVCIHCFLHVRICSAKDPASIVRVVDFAVLAGPFRWTVASVITKKVLANCVRLLTRIARALVSGVYFTMGPGCSRWTVTSVADLRFWRHSASAAIQARFPVAIGASEFTVVSVIIVRTETRVAGLFRGTNSSVLTR